MTRSEDSLVPAAIEEEKEDDLHSTDSTKEHPNTPTKISPNVLKKRNITAPEPSLSSSQSEPALRQKQKLKVKGYGRLQMNVWQRGCVGNTAVGKEAEGRREGTKS